MLGEQERRKNGQIEEEERERAARTSAEWRECLNFQGNTATATDQGNFDVKSSTRRRRASQSSDEDERDTHDVGTKQEPHA